jgi:hypothetical protein
MIDAEQRDEYVIDVIVQDRASSPLSTTCQIPIRIVDIIDNPPVFVSPTNRRITINRLRSIGSQLVQVRATDADRNDTITYSIVIGGRCLFVFSVPQLDKSIILYRLDLL